MVENLLLKSTERIFRIPALILIKENGEMTTTEIINALRDIFVPEGKDTVQGKNRGDDLFSQKVRNIKSHDSLDDFVYYQKKEGWTLKPAGFTFMNDNIEIVSEIASVMSNSYFNYYEKITFIDAAIKPLFPRKKIKETEESAELPIKKIKYFDELVSEGNSTTKLIKTYERSKKLRESAIEHFKEKDGDIKCAICGYSFGNAYGDYGKGYIEIHHKKPIYSYDDEKDEETIEKAMNNLVPVCANCHRMLHHKKDIKFEEVCEIYKKNKRK